MPFESDSEMSVKVEEKFYIMFFHIPENYQEHGIYHYNLKDYDYGVSHNIEGI